MRHRTQHRKLNRTSAHRKAMLRNLAQSLIQHGTVRTTIPKARELQSYVEGLVTLAREARDGDVVARRQIHKLLSDRSFVPADRQSEYDDMSLAKRAKTMRARNGRRYRTGAPRGKLAFTGRSVTHKLVTEWAARFEGRAGGYTRLVKMPVRRIGDGGFLAVVQFVGDEEAPSGVSKPERSARQRRTNARYALAVKLAKQRRTGERAEQATQTETSVESAEGGETTT